MSVEHCPHRREERRATRGAPKNMRHRPDIRLFLPTPPANQFRPTLAAQLNSPLSPFSLPTGPKCSSVLLWVSPMRAARTSATRHRPGMRRKLRLCARTGCADTFRTAARHENRRATKLSAPMTARPSAGSAHRALRRERWLVQSAGVLPQMIVDAGEIVWVRTEDCADTTTKLLSCHARLGYLFKRSPTRSLSLFVAYRPSTDDHRPRGLPPSSASSRFRPTVATSSRTCT